jgi:hypothetical protein
LNHIQQTAKTYKVNTCNKVLIKQASQTGEIKTGLIETPFNIHYC